MIVTLVLPMHNEASRIESTVEVAEKILSNHDSEIIVSEDGCIDGTPELARELERQGRIKHLHSDKKLGRGRAVERAFSVAKGDILLYMDADLSTNPERLQDLIGALKGGCDVVTGSRYVLGSETTRNPIRKVLSFAYNFFTRLLLGSKVRDHQCGFKGLTRKAADELLPLEYGHWFWDTELLVKAQRAGFSVKEIPVEWKEVEKGSKVDIIKDALEMGVKVIALAIKMRGREMARRGEGISGHSRRDTGGTWVLR